jgi:hypothetical protein
MDKYKIFNNDVVIYPYAFYIVIRDVILAYSCIHIYQSQNKTDDSSLQQPKHVA